MHPFFQVDSVACKAADIDGRFSVGFLEHPDKLEKRLEPTHLRGKSAPIVPMLPDCFTMLETTPSGMAYFLFSA